MTCPDPATATATATPPAAPAKASRKRKPKAKPKVTRGPRGKSLTEAFSTILARNFFTPFFRHVLGTLPPEKHSIAGVIAGAQEIVKTETGVLVSPASIRHWLSECGISFVRASTISFPSEPVTTQDPYEPGESGDPIETGDPPNLEEEPMDPGDFTFDPDVEPTKAAPDTAPPPPQNLGVPGGGAEMPAAMPGMPGGPGV